MRLYNALTNVVTFTLLGSWAYRHISTLTFYYGTLHKKNETWYWSFCKVLLSKPFMFAGKVNIEAIVSNNNLNVNSTNKS